MAATFMIGGIVSAAINRVNLDDGINMVLDGARGAFSGALIDWCGQSGPVDQ